MAAILARIFRGNHEVATRTRGLTAVGRSGDKMKMHYHLTAQISASAVRANLALLRECLSPGTKLCAVVKADCYGHCLELLAGVIAQQADCLAVATAQEAISLRRMGYQRQILMFSSPGIWAGDPEPPKLLEQLISENVTLTVVSVAEVSAVAQAARRLGAEADVHVKIDTGMTRSGAAAHAAPGLVENIRRQENLKLTGLYTHFATADEADKSFAREQLRLFLATVDECGGRGGLTLHAANSAATIDLPETHLDMVRPGIAVYGYQPSPQMLNRLPLRPALRLTGTLMQVKDVPAGARCGYGLTHTFAAPSRVGLVPVGYADGYRRCLSNRAVMGVGGADAPVRGRVSMDQTIIDLGKIPAAKVGDEVEIISPDPAAANSVENLALLAGTIPHEITCLLGRRVRRVPAD